MKSEKELINIRNAFAKDNFNKVAQEAYAKYIFAHHKLRNDYTQSRAFYTKNIEELPPESTSMLDEPNYYTFTAEQDLIYALDQAKATFECMLNFTTMMKNHIGCINNITNQNTTAIAEIMAKYEAL